MKYLATIKYAYDTYSQSFNSQKEAEQWLDTQNNNLEYTTVVTVYSNQWKELYSYEYTKGTE